MLVEKWEIKSSDYAAFYLAVGSRDYANKDGDIYLGECDIEINELSNIELVVLYDSMSYYDRLICREMAKRAEMLDEWRACDPDDIDDLMERIYWQLKNRR